MEKEGGVYTVPCKINGVPLRFIFDTGASDVSISLTEAAFMMKNGYLKKEDIGESVYYSIANGDVAKGTKLNIKEIEFSGLKLYNIEASIVHETSAPLLLGQSVIEKLGKIQIEGNKLTIFNSYGSEYDYTRNTSININHSNSLNWLTNVDEAYALSKSSKKPIFAKFIGSDWCTWCKKLEETILTTDRFINWAVNNVVLLEIDFPRYKKQTEQTVIQNTNLKQGFQVEGFPTIWIFNLDKNPYNNQYDIKPLGKTGYNTSLEDFMQGVIYMCK